MIHTEITPTEMADRVAIRELADAYAHCADRRLAEEQKSLFTEHTHSVVYMNGQGSEPTHVLDRAWLFADRKLYVDWPEPKPSHP